MASAASPFLVRTAQSISSSIASIVSPTSEPEPPSQQSYTYMSRPGTAQYQNSSPSAERRSLEGRYVLEGRVGSVSNASGIADIHNISTLPSIRIRHLPVGMTHDALTSMLLFAEDFVDATFTSTDLPDDTGFLAAIARFRTQNAADEVRARLHGKTNSTNDANLIVESIPPYGHRLSDTDSDSIGIGLSSAAANARSPPASNGRNPGSRPSSRFNSTFQSMSGIGRPAVGGSPSALGEPQLVGPHGMQPFDAASPRSTTFGDHFRASGKAVINNDGPDDDTGEILRDPIAFAQNNIGVGGQQNAMPRRHGSITAHHQGSQQQQQSQTQLPLSRLANLTLDTSSSKNHLHISPPSAGPFRHMQGLQSPTSEMSPTSVRSNMGPMSANPFPMSPSHLQRHPYPPVNPADQNPPCNTLYVGNLPMDTSEDELKNVFSKQRGYKRLCFRTKHNGPMCFVEFEDISFATKALNELYGHPLHNSVKGGIRLSFSKNPLGVRSGQAPNLGPNSPLGSPTGLGFGNVLGAPPGFATANGPPPGLAAPPGLSPPINTGMTGFFTASSPPSMAAALHQHSRGSISFASGQQNPQSPIGGGLGFPPDGMAGGR